VIRLHGKGEGTYRWFPPDGLSDVTVPDPVATVNNSIKYSLVVTNEFSCTDTDDVNVMLVPADFKVREQNDLCIGDTIRLEASGGNTYEWSPVDSLYPFDSPEPIVWPQTGRSYFVTIKDTICHRSATLEAKVFVHQLPDVRIEIARDVDCGLQYGQLGAVGAAKYTWLPVDGLDNPNAQFTYARPAQSTEYIVTGIDEWGCENTDTALIKVFEGNGRLFTPNAFTPNGDGKNDCFKVYIPGDVSGFQLTIVNRWGQAVYQSNSFDGCWNGTYNGQLAELGTYFYHYKGVSSVCGELFGKGDVQLIR
jgi:gliding motility-associated-like protein